MFKRVGALEDHLADAIEQVEAGFCIGGLGQFNALALHERVAVGIPVGPRIVGSEHGGDLLRLAGEADREIRLDETVQRFGNVGRGLVVGDDLLEAVDRREVFATLEIVAADFHFLAGELIADHVGLQLGVAGVVAFRETGGHFGQREQGKIGAGLIAANLSGPIFTFGAIEGQVASAEAGERLALAAYQQFDRALLVQIFVTQIFVFVESSFSALFGLLIAILLLITVRYLERRELEQARRGLMFSPAAEGPGAPAAAPA